jgi:multicomponent Na+:H+ antiporter subunit F
MTEFLLAAAAFVLAIAAPGLVRLLRGPSNADRMLAPQLLGTAGVAALLLLGEATRELGVADVAMVLALLSAFASVAFVAGSVYKASGVKSRIATEGEPKLEPALEAASGRTPNARPSQTAGDSTVNDGP